MSGKRSRRARPFEIVMDELGANEMPWDLDEHLQGCLAGYQTEDPDHGTAVHFALEALWGIARDVEIRADAGELDSHQLDADWTINPTTEISVPWIWVCALATAWSIYKEKGGPLGHAFGLEGGQGKPPKSDKMTQLLNERAIARLIWTHAQDAKAEGKEKPIGRAKQDAAIKFGKSDETIDRVWKRFGRLERQRRSTGS